MYCLRNAPKTNRIWHRSDFLRFTFGSLYYWRRWIVKLSTPKFIQYEINNVKFKVIVLYEYKTFYSSRISWVGISLMLSKSSRPPFHKECDLCKYQRFPFASLWHSYSSYHEIIFHKSSTLKKICNVFTRIILSRAVCPSNYIFCLFAISSSSYAV